MSTLLPARRPGRAVGGESEDGSEGDERGARNRRLVAVGAVVVLVASAMTWVVAFSPLLGAKSVRVLGTHTITVAQVRAAAAIKRGSPLVRLDTGAVARRVESLPSVASATVRTAFPSSVIITVTERVAVGFVSSGDSWVLVDRTGDQYRRVAIRPRSLPLFVVPAGANAKAAGQAVATVAAALTPALLARVVSVQAFDPTAVTLLLADRRVVRWGSADRSADKARILPVLLSQPGTRFDVTDPDQVVTH